MKKVIGVSLTLLTLTLAACGNKSGGSGAPAPGAVVTPNSNLPGVPMTNGRYSYEFSVNGCSTGKKEFTSVQAYCQGLLDDALNNNCARDLRASAYNRLCVGGGNVVTANPGMNSMNTARCVVNGSDNKDRTLLQNLNPFNPRRRQVIRDIFWDGRNDRSYDILGTLVASYGKAKFTMQAATRDLPAAGVIGLVQGDGDDSFLVSSRLGSQISLTVQNDSERKETQVVCMSDSTFKRPKRDLRQLRCVYKEHGMRNSREETISWDLRSVSEQQIFEKSASEMIVLRLKPAAGGQDERIELDLRDLDYDKSMTAEGTVNEGLEVRFNSRSSGANTVLSCAPASK